MNDLLLHPLTRRAIEHFVAQPSHALLITGEEGAGKVTVAIHVARALLSGSTNDINLYSYYRALQPVDNVISIEAVRELQRFFQLKTVGTETIRRVAVVKSAHLMTTEAQNALLKILEEPPEDTVIILTADPTRALLQTVYSRTQQISLNTPSLDQSTEFFSKRGNRSQEISKNYYLSNGQIGLLSALLENNTEHPLVRDIELAKRLISSPKLTSLSQVDGLSKDKTRLAGLLQACKRLAHAAMQQAISNQNEKASTQWLARLEVIQSTESALRSNPNSKLLLTNLLLNL